MKDELDMEKRKREEEEAAAKKARERELAEVRGKVDDALKDSRDLNVISPQKKVRRVRGNLTTAIEEAKRLNTPGADVQNGESRSKELEELLVKMPARDSKAAEALRAAIDDPAAVDDLREALDDCERYGFDEMDDQDNTVTLLHAKQSYAYRVAYDIGRAVLNLRQAATPKILLATRSWQPGAYANFMRKYLDKQPAVVLTRLREALGKCKELDYSTEEVEQGKTVLCDIAATQVQTMVRILRAKKVAASMKDVVRMLEAARDLSENSDYTELTTIGKRLMDAVDAAKRLGRGDAARVNDGTRRVKELQNHVKAMTKHRKSLQQAMLDKGNVEGLQDAIESCERCGLNIGNFAKRVEVARSLLELRRANNEPEKHSALTKCEKLLPLPDDIPKDINRRITKEIKHAIPLPKGWELCKHEDEHGNEFRYYANEATGAEQSHRPRELQPGWVEKHNEDKTECWYEREETGERRGMNERPDLSVQEEIDKFSSSTRRRLSDWAQGARNTVAVNTALAELENG